MAKSIIRFAEVNKRTGLSKSEIDRREKAGLFPKRVSIGARSVAWIEDEVSAWIEARIRESRAPTAPKAA